MPTPVGRVEARGCRRHRRAAARPACPAGSARPRARRRGTAARTPCSRRRSELIVCAMRPAPSRMPSPKSSTPQLFETTVRPSAPCSGSAAISSGDAAEAEAADGERGAGRDVGDGLAGGRHDLVHAAPKRVGWSARDECAQYPWSAPRRYQPDPVRPSAGSSARGAAAERAPTRECRRP